MPQPILKSPALPVFIALLGAGTALWWVNTHINPYSGSILDEKTYSYQLENYYIDLDNNSQKEKVQLVNYGNLGRPMVKVRNLSNRDYLGIWNLKGEILENAPLLFADHNHDGKKEIYAFSRIKDSIFIYGIDYQKENQYLVEKMFVARTRFFENKIDLKVRPVGQEDLNEDGYNELYFAIDAGFSMKPRRIYAVDVKNCRVHSSPRAGIRYKQRGLIMFDLNHDGEKEILASTHASDNYSDTSSFPYNDNSSWLMAFDKKLRFLFEPVEFKGSPAGLSVIPYSGKEKNYIATLHLSHDKDHKEPFKLSLYSTQGRHLKSINLFNIQGIDHSSYFATFQDRKDWNDLFISNRKGQVYYFNERLELIHSKDISEKKIIHCNYIDIDPHIEGNEIFIPTSQGFIITDQAFNELMEVDGMGNSLGLYRIYTHQRDGKTILYAQDKRKAYKMNLSTTWLYETRWWVTTWVFLLVLLIFYLQRQWARRRKARMIKRKLRFQEAEKKRLAKDLHDELGNRLMGLRLQMEEMKNGENRDKLDQAIDYIHKTHQEIRNIIHNLTPPRFREYDLISLLQELLDEYDHYSAISVHFQAPSDGKPKGLVPENVKFQAYRILQEALTNTIKHSGGDQAWVRLEKDRNHLYLHIEDNGEGFDTSLIESQNKGLGLENMKLRAELLNGSMTIKTNRQGTLLRIKLPLHQTV